MLIAYYIVAGLAAIVFIIFGMMKLASPKEKLQERGMGWVEGFSTPVVKLIALADVLGGLGLILPMATGIAQALSPIAGICLAVLMIGAIAVHARRKESVGFQIGMLALAVSATVLGFLTIA
ncbi:DoxX family protein [Microbacterium aurum]